MDKPPFIPLFAGQ
ncbi:Protein of unknown function [Bacillus mycoides]|nr:Protein of unknown function [Bacillus mycoides]